MANKNLKCIREIVENLNLQAQIIPSASNPLNCQKIIIQGHEFKCSQWTKTIAEVKLAEFKENKTCSNTINLSNEKCLSGEDLIKEFIVFGGKSFNKCLIEYIELIMQDKTNSFSAWLTQLYNMVNLDDNDNIIDYNFNSKNYALSILASGNVTLYKGYVFTQKGIEYLVRAWYNSNKHDCTISTDKAKRISYNVLNKLKELNF